MKRVGHLFEKAFTHEALYQAWLDASHGKRNRRATLEFSRHLSRHLDALHDALHSGEYQPQPYHLFKVYEPKERLIYAPAFRDLVVQHAIYRLIYPLFNAGFIDHSYACRKGKGTHAAADYAHAALRASKADHYVLQMDIKRFFYTIDRTILRQQIERKIKDRRFVDVMMQFSEYGEPIGIPIGNLLSQVYALIYLNPLDHFIKRGLKAQRYCRYVDDFIVFGWTRERCVTALEKIKNYLRDELGLALSHYSLHKVRRGLNFVGYRTWQRVRFIRKHSLFNFTRAMTNDRPQSVISILGHARKTGSFRHLMATLQVRSPTLYETTPYRWRKVVS
jgi:retron-type reverse transcriptase